MTDCDDHDDDDSSSISSHVVVAVGAVVFTVLLAIFLVWVILQPRKPQFVLQDFTLYYLNLTETNTLSSYMQATLTAKNPNKRIGIYYEKLDIYASYREQPITLATDLPYTFQATQDFTVWSPFLNGAGAPVAPWTVDLLAQDDSAGALLLELKVEGKLEWQVGSWTSGTYQIQVNCPTYIRFAPQYTGIKFQIAQNCIVDVYL